MIPQIDKFNEVRKTDKNAFICNKDGKRMRISMSTENVYADHMLVSLLVNSYTSLTNCCCFSCIIIDPRSENMKRELC